MSALPPEDEPRPSGREDGGEEELPPPATWAGGRSEPPDAEAPPTEPPPPQDPPAPEPPPVEEPPDPDRPPPVEEPPAPGVPPSGEAQPAAEDREAGVPALSDEDEEGAEEPAGPPPPARPATPRPGRPATPRPGRPATPGPGRPAAPRGKPATPGPAPPGPGRPAAPAPVGPRAGVEGEDDSPPRAGLWPRFVAASLVIVISMATATAASALLYLSDIAEGLGAKLPGVRNQLQQVDGGEPQTILILGSDIRPDIEDKGRSDTTMLLRLDADRDVLSLLSLPRDLKVNIPGYGIGKLNEAYLIGGPKLTTKVVKQVTGLEIAHVVNVDFSGFAEAVNAIECVFVDVDRDYFHSNEGLGADQQYAEIDVDAGYRQLCGLKALQYVRYRHDDNDLVRAARQQSFLREARQKVPPGRLLGERDKFIKIFTKHTTSDIDDPIAILDVLKLFVELRDAPVRRIEFEGDLGDADATYVTASNKQVRSAIDEFLGLSEGGGGGGKPGGGGGKSKGKGGSKGGGGGKGASDVATIDASQAAQRYALQFGPTLRFPVYAPVKLKPGSAYSDDSHAYRIDTYDGEHYPSYKLVFERTGPFGVPEYYGVMGTRWDDPPILENPSEVRAIGERQYLLFYEGDRLQVVGFKTRKASYWVSNTLLGTLGENEMLAIAESMKPF